MEYLIFGLFLALIVFGNNPYRKEAKRNMERWYL